MSEAEPHPSQSPSGRRADRMFRTKLLPGFRVPGVRVWPVDEALMEEAERRKTAHSHAQSEALGTLTHPCVESGPLPSTRLVSTAILATISGAVGKLPGPNFMRDSVQRQSISRGWLHHVFSRRRHHMRHLGDLRCFLAKQVLSQLSYTPTEGVT